MSGEIDNQELILEQIEYYGMTESELDDVILDRDNRELVAGIVASTMDRAELEMNSNDHEAATLSLRQAKYWLTNYLSKDKETETTDE